MSKVQVWIELELDDILEDVSSNYDPEDVFDKDYYLESDYVQQAIEDAYDTGYAEGYKDGLED